MNAPSSSRFDRLDRGIRGLSTFLVGFGGACLVIACLLTLASVLGALALRPLPGEIELVEALCGLAVFAFLPYCQLKRGHVGVDLVISSLGPKAMNRTQLIGDTLIALLIAVITWRHGIGTVDKFGNGETTPLLLLPLWWGYAIALALLVANLLVCLHVILLDIREMRRGHSIATSMGAH